MVKALDNKRILTAAVVGAVVGLVVSIAVTHGHPWRPIYEVRYEFKVRDYQKNVDSPYRVLGGLSQRDSYWLYGYLEGLPIDEGLKREVKYDNTEKITLHVTGDDSGAVASYAAQMYAKACDTVTRYGEEMCLHIEEELNRMIGRLPSPTTDSLHMLQKELYEQLAVVTAEKAGGDKYIFLLNGAELPGARRTLARGWILLISTVVASILALGGRMLKN